MNRVSYGSQRTAPDADVARRTQPSIALILDSSRRVADVGRFIPCEPDAPGHKMNAVDGGYQLTLIICELFHGPHAARCGHDGYKIARLHLLVDKLRHDFADVGNVV